MAREKKNYLGITRTVKAEILTHNNINYVRTREIADILGVKQPFEFTHHIEEELGPVTVRQAPFATKQDSSRTVFISVNNMLAYMECKTAREHKVADDRWYKMMKSLEEYTNKEDL